MLTWKLLNKIAISSPKSRGMRSILPVQHISRQNPVKKADLARYKTSIFRQIASKKRVLAEYKQVKLTQVVINQ